MLLVQYRIQEHRRQPLIGTNLAGRNQSAPSSGAEASVVAHRRYEPNASKRNLVQLITRHGNIKVSAKHPIVVASDEGRPTEKKLAKCLEIGDRVFVGEHAQRLTKIIKTEERAELFMISFHPDEPVEAFIAPQQGVLTKGEPLSPSSLAYFSEAELLQATPMAYED